MSNYWLDRYLSEYKKTFEITVQKMQKEIGKQYKKVEKQLETRLTSLYNELLASSQDETLLPSDLYKYQHYYDLLNDTKTLLTNLGSKQIKVIDKGLTDYYLTVCSQIGKGYGINNLINQDLAKRAVNSIWLEDGKKWSDRIWYDKQVLINNLEEGLANILATGQKTDQLINFLQEQFNTSFSNSERLVRTEMSHIQNESSLDRYQQAGCKNVQFVDTEDERTCPQCAQLDGKLYDIQAARAIIPVHPNCRCTWIPK